MVIGSAVLLELQGFNRYRTEEPITENKTIAKLLKFKELKVVGIDFKKGSILKIAVKPWKNGGRRCQCERRGKIIRTRPCVREWRDVPVGGWTVFLVYASREIRCATHGRVEEWLPWADQYSRFSYRYEYLVLRYSQMMTQKAATELLHVSLSTLSNQLHRCIKRIHLGHRIRAPEEHWH